MAEVLAQQVALTGTALTFNAASGGGGDTFPAGDDITVIVKNGSGGGVVPTFVTTKTESGLAIADLAGASCAAGAQKEYGPFPAAMFADDDGLVNVTWSATSSITFAVRRVPTA